MLEDVRRYNLAKLLKFQILPGEIDRKLDDYWLNRIALFEKVLGEVQEHQMRQK